MNSAGMSIFVSPLKWTGFGNPRHHQKGAFYERNQYLFWCFFRSDLDSCSPSSAQNTNGTNPNAGLRITNGVSGLRSNHTSILVLLLTMWKAATLGMNCDSALLCFCYFHSIGSPCV